MLFCLMKCSPDLTVVAELGRRGWRTKTWTTGKGKPRSNQRSNKTNPQALLTNITYVGKRRGSNRGSNSLRVQ
jgi:hypothetical protein